MFEINRHRQSIWRLLAVISCVFYAFIPICAALLSFRPNAWIVFAFKLSLILACITMSIAVIGDLVNRIQAEGSR